jgi:crotonobetainyl-CoA:carnitine CoA-transferase CaiB-like acyl-CoA transferase
LAGLKVLDLSRVLAGPWAGQLLADMGADVIKVERPGAGDDTRQWGPPHRLDPTGQPTDEAAYFLAANRGKRSLALDIASPAGQRIIRQLALQSDVVLENFKRGTLARYGLDHATLAADHPALVMASITGFGQTGPHADRPGYDFVIQGMAGLMSITGTPESGPTKVGVAVVDITTGLYTVIGVLAAALHARATGQGQHLDLALFDVQLGWLANQAMNVLAAGRTPGLLGNAHPSIVPYQDFPTADGRITIAVGNDRQFAALCRVLGVADWSADPRFSSNAARVAHRDILIADLTARLSTHPSAHWLAALEAADVPCGPILTIAEALASPQAVARDLVIEQPHPVAGTVRTVANPIRFSATPVDYPEPPPMLGAHSRHILHDLGYSEIEIDALFAEGVVG